MPQEAVQDEMSSKSAAQTVTMTSNEVQDLEAQIATQMPTHKQAAFYFGSRRYAITDLLGHRLYATASQVQQLAHKHHRAVKELNLLVTDDNMPDFYDARQKPLQIPKPEVCEFCGKTLDYIAIIRHQDNEIYEWEVEKWSKVPLRCNCRRAQAKWDAQDAEEKRLADNEKQQREENERKKKVLRQLAQSGMKKRFLSRTFANFQTDTPERARAYKVAKEYADNFTTHKANGDGLYIEGTFGTGKTHLAAAIAIQLMEQGYNVIFKTADDLLLDIKATFDEKSHEEHRVLERMKNCELLVIDDIGKEQATDWSTSQLYAIINDRYECQKPLIITTNFNETDLVAVESPKGVGSHRIEAILSRLHETCCLMTMSWKDWRGA